MEKNRSGITLIALIITVIVLLILAGTAVSIAINGESLFTKTQEAKSKWNEAVKNEETELQNLLTDLALYSGENMQIVSETKNGLTILSGIIVDDAKTYAKVSVGINTEELEHYKKEGDDLWLAFLQTHGVYGPGYPGTTLEDFLNGYNSYLQGTAMTEEAFKEKLMTETNTSTYEDALEAFITEHGGELYTQEEYTISVKKDGNEITLTNSSFLIDENNSTYEITATSATGKSSTKTIQVIGIAKETFATPNSTDYIDQNGQHAKIPTGYYVGTSNSVNTIANGLVITNHIDSNGHSDGDEFVWIPADINDMVMCKSNAAGSICVIEQQADGSLKCVTHNKTAVTDFCGRLYNPSYTTTVSPSDIETVDTKIYQSDLNFTEEYKAAQRWDENGSVYDSDWGCREPDIVKYSDKASNIDKVRIAGVDSVDELKSQLQNDFYEMAKSVAKYGGFWISRYEVGINGTSKMNQAVRTSVYSNGNMWYGLYNECRNIDNTNNIAETMIWGSQYDQAIHFIGERALVGHTDIGLESTYCTSGFVPLDKLKNIYDLEGNLFEWTAETRSGSFRMLRGGERNKYAFTILFSRF